MNPWGDVELFKREVIMRYCASFLVFCVATTLGAPLSLSAAQAASTATGEWVIPRTPDGRPDLQGNWTNVTVTPIQRQQGQGLVLTPDQVAAIEGQRERIVEAGSAASDPDRAPPPAGGTNPICIDAATTCYNYIYWDQGDRVAIFNGEPRSSLVTNPADGRIPPLTPEAELRYAGRTTFSDQFGDYDNPENRPLAERCIMSYGSNAGPPMLPNYGYNNNYTIVQTPDHIMIMTEMVHDVRIIRLGARVPLPQHIRPWMGDSWGHWEGDTLVIETTNLPPGQLNALEFYYPGGSRDMKVIERLTRSDETTINYEFTVIDPLTYTSTWGGEVPMKRLDDLIYEYACHEGNYALGNVLRGARYQERMEASGGRD